MCDAHHLIPRHQGRPTDIDQLCLLCRRHHRPAHTTDWHLHHHPHHGLARHTPTHGTLPAQNATTPHHSRRTRPPADPDPPETHPPQRE